MSFVRRLAPLALLLCFTVAAAAQQQKPRSLDVVSYDQLGKLVRDLKGKVVVVYIWSYG
jgi:hypothetical protein